MIKISELDSHRFKKVIARADDKEQLQDIENFCFSCGVDMLVLRCDTTNASFIQKLCGTGYFLADTLVYYEKTIDLDADEEKFNVANQDDKQQIINIALGAFSSYKGHYHCDKRLDPYLATYAYVDWISRALCDRDGKEVLVRRDGEKVVGFLLSSWSGDVGEIELYAIAPDSQHHGLGALLVRDAQSWAKSQGLKKLITSTQIVNVNSQRAFNKSGLKICRSCYTFHKWFK